MRLCYYNKSLRSSPFSCRTIARLTSNRSFAALAPFNYEQKIQPGIFAPVPATDASLVKAGSTLKFRHPNLRGKPMMRQLIRRRDTPVARCMADRKTSAIALRGSEQVECLAREGNVHPPRSGFRSHAESLRLLKRGLVTIDNPSLNFVMAASPDSFHVDLMNEADQEVNATRTPPKGFPFDFLVRSSRLDAPSNFLSNGNRKTPPRPAHKRIL